MNSTTGYWVALAVVFFVGGFHSFHLLSLAFEEFHCSQTWLDRAVTFFTRGASLLVTAGWLYILYMLIRKMLGAML